MSFIPAKLAKVIVLDNRAYHNNFIAESDGPRHFAIEIGLFEAIALVRKIERKSDTPRPMTHDLLANAITALGGSIRSVRITELKRSTYFAEIVVETDDGEVHIDARPSDAMVLAAHERCELLVHDSVFKATSTI